MCANNGLILLNSFLCTDGQLRPPRVPGGTRHISECTSASCRHIISFRQLINWRRSNCGDCRWGACSNCGGCWSALAVCWPTLAPLKSEEASSDPAKGLFPGCQGKKTSVSVFSVSLPYPPCHSFISVYPEQILGGASVT